MSLVLRRSAIIYNYIYIQVNPDNSNRWVNREFELSGKAYISISRRRLVDKVDDLQFSLDCKRLVLAALHSDALKEENLLQ